MTGTDRKTHREITGNQRFTSQSVTAYYRLKNLPFWWRTQPDDICSNRKTTGISVSIYYIRKLSLILKKTQRGRSRKSQRGQIVLIIKTQRGRSRKSQRGQIILIIKTQRGQSRKSQRGQIVLIIKTQRGRSRKSQRGQIVFKSH